MGNTIYRKLSCLLLSAALVFTLFLPAESHGASNFKDVRGHWAETYINDAVRLGIIKGYTDGNFLPDEKVSRAEFVSMINRALGNTATGSTRFNDVSSGAWYYSDVSKAVTAGFVSGFDDGTFRPNHKITRQEAAVILARIIPTQGASTNLSRFSDHRSISDWAYTALSKVGGKGYISGYTDGRMHPLDSLTRAQAAKIISDIVKNETIVTTDPVVKKDGTRLSGRIYSNNVTIHRDLDDGSASLENCVVLGKLIVQGGGESTVTVNNSRVANAVVDRSGDIVRLLARGETAIVNTEVSRGFALQTTSLSGGAFGPGFEKVSVKASASGSLHGNFPQVSIDGSSAQLQLLSGTISKLDVSSSGRRSEITVENRATVNQTNVYAESYFRGTGTISDMQVYAKGITYETKPKKITVRSGGETPTEEDPELKITFDPKQGATRVNRDTKITITFNSAMREADGSTITNSEIQDIVTIRKGSATGSTVAYSGTISSDKKVMTLTPSSLLDENTRYYIVIKARTMIDSNDDRNEAETSYFNTGTGTETLAVTYSPANGDTGVPVDRKSFTITFTEDVKRYSGSGSLNESYLKDNVITFQRGSSNINTSNYTVAYNSTNRRITVTLRNDYKLDMNTSYTLGIKRNSLKTDDGTNVDASSARWTTTGNPALSSPGTTSYETAVDLKVTPNVSGTIYAVLVAGDAKAPLAAQVRDGKDGTGKDAVAVKTVAVAASNANKVATVNLSGDKIARDTAYKVYAVLYDGNGNASTVVDRAVTTEPLKLKSLTIIPDTGTSNILTFKPETLDYGTILVPNGTTSVKVTAVVNTDTFDGERMINGESAVTRTVDLVDGKATIEVYVKENSAIRSVQYKLKVQARGSTDIDRITINDVEYRGAAHDVRVDAGSVSLAVWSKDLNATITVGTISMERGVPKTLGLNPDTDKLIITIRSADGETKNHTVLLNRTAAE